MSVMSCIARLHSEGKINDRQRKEAEDVYNGVFGRLYPNMPRASAEATAAVQTAEILDKLAQQRKYGVARNMIATAEGQGRIDAAENPIRGFMDIMSSNIHGRGSINAESMAHDYESRWSKAMNGIMEKYGAKRAGFKQDTAGVRNLMREIGGEDTGDKTAKELAEAWKAGDKFSTDTALKLGKSFSPIEDYRPQHWEGSRVRKFGTEAFNAMAREHNAKGGLEIIDPETGAPANPLRFEEILASSGQKIAKDRPTEGGLASPFNPEARVFRFTPGKAGNDAYLAMMDKFGIGSGGYVAALEGHVRRASHELAMAHMLGPDWRTTGEGLLNYALDKHATKDFSAPEKWFSGDMTKINPLESSWAARRLWDYTSGKTSQVGNEMLAGLFNGARAFATSRKLGSAIITAIPTDSVNWLMASRHLGMDQGRLLATVTRDLFFDNATTRADVARLGINAQSAAVEALTTKRFSDQVLGENFMGRLGQTVIHGQGLARWDQVIRRSFIKEFLGTIASRAGKSWDDLDAPFKDHFLTAYNFTPKEWDTLADPAHHLDLGEASYLDLDKLTAKDEGLRQKLMSAVYDEQHFAYVVGGSNRIRAMTHGGQAGTLPAELARSSFLFKNFPMTFLGTWGARAMTQPGAIPKLMLAGRLLAYTTFAGALTMQAKALLQGKDPVDMTNPASWLDASVSGGGFGIAGDWIREVLGGHGTPMEKAGELMLGPLASDVKDVGDLVLGARDEVLDQKVNFGAQLARDIKDFTPGNNLWYLRLMAQRMLFDEIQKEIDPNYQQSFDRQRERSLKLRNQDFYWAPGETAPARGPNLGAAVGQQ
jgi:hypothetical protein